MKTANPYRKVLNVLSMICTVFSVSVSIPRPNWFDSGVWLFFAAVLAAAARGNRESLRALFRFLEKFAWSTRGARLHFWMALALTILTFPLVGLPGLIPISFTAWLKNPVLGLPSFSQVSGDSFWSFTILVSLGMGWAFPIAFFLQSKHLRRSKKILIYLAVVLGYWIVITLFCSIITTGKWFFGN